MTATYEPLLEDAIEIDATPARVWALVSDVRRMPEWSPQVTSTRLRAGWDEVALGAEFTNRNEQDGLEWTTHGRVVELDPERRIAFRIEENWVVWSFTLEPAGGATRLVQRREAPDGISDLSLELTDGFLGGQEAFTATMRAGMRQTLEAIRSAAEA
ncbi:MAG TPA: SRPBCC family protein [Nocardioides sp.]|nr:SRPBCC family protein [Nocardioides sp.]